MDQARTFTDVKDLVTQQRIPEWQGQLRLCLQLYCRQGQLRCASAMGFSFLAAFSPPCPDFVALSGQLAAHAHNGIDGVDAGLMTVPPLHCIHTTFQLRDQFRYQSSVSPAAEIVSDWPGNLTARVCILGKTGFLDNKCFIRTNQWTGCSWWCGEGEEEEGE